MPRVLTARFMHETNTFSRVKTDMALIRRRAIGLRPSRRSNSSISAAAAAVALQKNADTQ